VTDQKNNGGAKAPEEKKQLTPEELEKMRSPAGNLPLEVQEGTPEPMRYNLMPLADREQEIYHAGAATMLSIFASRLQGMPNEVLSQFGQLVGDAIPMPADKDETGNLSCGPRVSAFIKDCMARIGRRVQMLHEQEGAIVVARPGDVERMTAGSKIAALTGANKRPKVLKKDLH